MEEETARWLDEAAEVLLHEGFRNEPLKQARKPGQVWGLVRQEPDDMQTHVRGFKDGRLETEIELSNRFIQHLWSHRRSAHDEVKKILEQHGLATDRVSETFVPRTGSRHDKTMPEGRTKNWHVGLVLGIGLAAAMGARFLRVFRR